ncbi:MAG: DUF5994 family protein [Marmoricola sp.]
MSATRQPFTHPQSGEDVRLRLGTGDGPQQFDGAWWPHSRDLVGQLPALIQQFPLELGEITRVYYCGQDWDTAPLLVDLGSRYLRVGSFVSDQPHVLVVQTASEQRLTLLVVPHDCTPMQGEDALAAASTSGNAQSASELIASVGS